MSPRAFASFVSFSLCLACAGEGAPQIGAKPTPTPARSEPKPVAAEPTKPEPAELRPADSEQLEPPLSELPAPSKAEALAASRAVIDHKLAELAPILALGPRRHALALRVLNPKAPFAAEVVIVVLEGSELDQEVRWSVTAKTSVHRVDRSGLDEGPPALPTTFEAQDYDDDGELELLIRWREGVMCGGGATVTAVEAALALGTTRAKTLHYQNTMITLLCI